MGEPEKKKIAMPLSYYKILDSIKEIKRHEDSIRQLKADIKTAFKKLPSETTDQNIDLVISLFYWRIPQVSFSEILEAFNLTPTEARELIFLEVVAPCDICGQMIYAETKGELTSLKQSFKYTKSKKCADCQRKESMEAQRQYMEEITIKAARLKELKAMPYKEYLQTPEWKETRKRAIKRAAYACQLCNTKTFQLNVHHRTYKQLGCEHNSDLIVLCKNCHEKHHDVINTCGSDTDTETPFETCQAD